MTFESKQTSHKLREDTFFLKFLFIWLYQALVVACQFLIGACGI